MTCPICLKVGETGRNSDHELIPSLIQLLDLSSPELRWKSEPHPKQWEWCGDEKCYQDVTQFLNVVQQFRDLKQSLGQSLHNLLEHLRLYCELDLEEWSRDKLEQQCSWECWDKKRNDDILNFDLDQDKGQCLVEGSIPIVENKFIDPGQAEEIGSTRNKRGLRPKRNVVKASEALQVDPGDSHEPDTLRYRKRKAKRVPRRKEQKKTKPSKDCKTKSSDAVQSPLNVPNCQKTCDKCNKTFLTSTSLRTHKRTHVREGMSNDGTFHCTHCPTILSSLGDLKQHRSEVHEKPRDFCPICRRQMSKGALVQHLHSHHLKQSLIPLPSCDGEEGINCHICDKPFSSPVLLAAHMSLHKGDYSCDVSTCKKSFYSLTARSKHGEAAHGPNSNAIDCSYCYQTFSSEQDDQDFRQHVKNHEDEVTKKRFLCESCGCGTYFTKKSLQQHLRQNHSTESVFTCEVCGKEFLNSQRLKVHILTHRDKKQSMNSASPASLFSCPEPNCGKFFGQKVSLQSHLMVHHATEMRYKCPHCDHSGFTYSQGLRSHVFKCHNEVFNDKNLCRVCYKNFSTEEELLLHEGNHNKLKCQLCSKQFKSMNHLKEHTLRHAAIRPFICPHCPTKGYVRKQQLNAHLQKVHQQDTTTAKFPQHNTNPGQLTERITYVIQIP